jgi:Dolichyl-phosphate-mannose-protein mannosyltransferase
MAQFKKNLLYLLGLALFVGFVVVTTKAYAVWEFDTDEGINLIKASLYSQGFSLYTEIWNDQPPLFTIVLDYWFNLFGQSMIAARLLVLILACILVWSFYEILTITIGTISALAGTLLLVTAWTFSRLSVSVMIGLPSLSLAMLSIYCLVLYKRRNNRFLLAISGSLLALSLQIKLITAFLIPLLILYLLDPVLLIRKFNSSSSHLKINSTDLSKNRCPDLRLLEEVADLERSYFNGIHLKIARNQIIFSILFWITVFLATYIFTGILFHSINLDQVLQPHLTERDKVGSWLEAVQSLFQLLREDIHYLLLGSLGILVILIKRKREGLLPIAWLGGAFLLISTHNPVWYHHYLLLWLPITWLAAYAIAIPIEFFERKAYHFKLSISQLRQLLLPGFIIVLLILALYRIPDRLTRPINERPVQDQNVINLVMSYKPQTHWMFTDRPIYAFYAGLPVPPEVAVMSRKRFHSGNLTFDDLLAILQRYHPEQIVLAKYIDDIKGNPELRTYIEQNYSKTYSNPTDRIEHYVDKQIAQSSSVAIPNVL